jgi:hypothetical protein
MFWLDYTKGEDLIQIGKVNLAAITRIRLFYSYKKVRSWIQVKAKSQRSLPNADASADPVFQE